MLLLLLCLSEGVPTLRALLRCRKFVHHAETLAAVERPLKGKTRGVLTTL